MSARTGLRPAALRATAGLAAALRAAAMLAAALSAMAAPPAASAPIAVADDRGIEHRFARPPQRIVSLLPSLTESVCALGACERLVGTDRYSNWPTTVIGLPKLGGLDDAQIERIVALRPDVVLAARSARVIDRLESLGVPVVALESRDHGDVRRTLQLLAVLLDRPTAAVGAWQAIEADLQRAAVRVPPALRGQTVYFEVSSAPHAAGAASFIGETLARLGLRNIVPTAMGPFPRLSPEYVLRANPAIVIGVEREVQAMRQRPGWHRIDALAPSAHRHCGFDEARYEVLIRPGPRLGEAALMLADCLRSLDR